MYVCIYCFAWEDQRQKCAIFSIKLQGGKYRVSLISEMEHGLESGMEAKLDRSSSLAEQYRQA